jgi:tetratricopeptide (TPR) repeat protein
MSAFRLAAVALGLCSAFAVAAQSSPPVAADMPRPAAPAPIDNSSLDAPLFYELLIGEIELSQGDAGTAYQVLLDAARKTRDERLYRRATEVALQAQAGDQALAAARAWRQAVPTSLDAHRYEVQLLVALNRIADAAEPLRSTLALVPANERAAAIASLPRYFSRTADRKAAAAVLEQVLRPYADGRVAGEPPSSATAAWVALGRARQAAGETAGALDAARRAIDADPRAEAATLLAIDLMATEPAAEDVVKRYLDARPAAEPLPRSAVRLVYARTLALSQRYAEAAPQIEEVTRDAPQFVEAWLTLGALRIEMKQPEAADAALREYLSRTEGVASEPAGAGGPEAEDEDAATPAQRRTQAYLLLAQAAEQRRDFKAAEKWLGQVESPQALAVQTRRASMLAQQGRLEEGRSLLRKLPERTPEDGRAKLVAEAQLLRDQKQWSAARGLLAEANQRYRDDSDLLYEQAMVAEKLDRMDEMEQLLRRVIALKPQQPAAYNALGYSLADRNQRLAEAKQLIQKALELTPGDPFLVDSLGWVEYRLGNRDEALKWLRQAYRARPDTEIAAHLGEVLWLSGQREEAKRVWSEGRSRDSANDVLKETLARLKVDL